jgi:hypothetical protein
MFVIFLLTHATAQSCSDTQYITTKPVCSGTGRCCIEGNVLNTGGASGTISDVRHLQFPANAWCEWIIGPFSSISFKFNTFRTDPNEVFYGENRKWDKVQVTGCTDPYCIRALTHFGTFAGTAERNRGDWPGLDTTYTSQHGYLKVYWFTTGSVSESGFSGTWTVTSPSKYPVCNTCPPNMRINSTVTAMTACVCNPGWAGEVYTGFNSNLRLNWNNWCQACAAGKYKSSALTCTDCPTMSTSTARSSSCTCNAGFGGDPFRSCSPCLPGQYKGSEGVQCMECPAGMVSNVNGSSACESCPAGSGPSSDRRRCETCPDGTQAIASGRCEDCRIGFYSNTDTNRLCVQCPSGFFSRTNRTTACIPCRACPDGYYRANCAFNTGGGTCVPCLSCGDGLVNVGCMNRAGNTDKAGICRNRTYVVRTPLCDQKNSGYGLGGYTFLDLFGVPQDDASFQCRRRCDNEQNILSRDVYTDNGTYTELVSQFPNRDSKPRAFNGGHCSGPYACDIANCNIPGSSDDSQTNYQPKLACPVYIDPAMTSAFWAAVEAKVDSSVVSVVNAMRETTCQTCASCGQGVARVQDWGRGCARDCTQLSCEPGFIFDWTEPVQSAKCKRCGELNSARLCPSSEQAIFESYDVSGRLPKIYMKQCLPKRQLPLRGYEIGYGTCVKCADFADTCASQRDTYYHTCEAGGTDIVATCKPCSFSNGRSPTTSRYWDGEAYQHLYCQQLPCAVSSGLRYTGIRTESLPHRICHATCKSIVCEGDASQVTLPCVLPHQRRCKASVDMDVSVNDEQYRPVAHTFAHSNILEPNTTEPHLFASFENVLVDHDAPTLSLRAQCVWNADFITDNNMNPAGISSRFQSKCRPWVRNPRNQYPLIPLQNTVTPNVADEYVFPRRILLNTSATAFAYAQGSVARPTGVFAGDVYLELDLTNTNNATLAVFIPDDRMIESATWVPRWRASVQAQQIAGSNMNLSIVAGTQQTCFACFALRIFPETPPSWTTVNMTTAISAFRGNKFLFVPSPGLLVCERSVQARAYQAFLEMRYGGNLSAMFASSLTDACVSTFGIQSQNFDTPADLIRSSGVVASGNCVVYTFSATRVYCLRRSGGYVELTWQTNIQGTIVDVSVHNGFLVRTLYSGPFALDNTINYISLLSSIDSKSETVLQVPGLLMFARGAPHYFLRRTTVTSLRLSKFETKNTTFLLNASATYQPDDVNIPFSKFVPISSKNTVLEFADDFLVFATAKYSGGRVIVYVSALDSKLVLLNTYSMKFAVFFVTSSNMPEKVYDAYDNIEYVGEALLSCTWLERNIFLLSVTIDGLPRGQFAPLLLNVTDLTLLDVPLQPDLLRAFDAPFVRAATAVLSAGKLLSCSECNPASPTSSSGFFAYGSSQVSYRRLLPCEEDNMYIEEDVAKSMPVTTCENVRYDSGNVYGITMQMTLQCVTLNPLEIVLELPPNREIAFGNGITYKRQERSRLLLSVPCEFGKPQFLLAFNLDACEMGCRYDLWSGGRLNIQGGITIESIRHRPSLSLSSERWDRRSLLQIDTPRATYLSRHTARQWLEHSVIVRSIAPRQQIDFRVTRDVSVEWLAAYKDNEQLLALDEIAVVPVLSEHFLPVVNSSSLMSIVYVPKLEDLRILALETLAHGDDILDWKRIHASVHVSDAALDLRPCSYMAHVIPVDNNLRMLTPSSVTGCLLDLALSAQCHIELPEKLTNDARILGVVISPVKSGCRVLSDADGISVEFAPFMRVSRCPAFSFLNANTLTCEACDTGEPFCPAGKYVSGCLPLIHPSIKPECLNCTAPNNSVFLNTSRGCTTWTCLDGFYRINGACARCTSLLTSVCRATGGLRRQNCTALENEKCVDCATKPRYSEWVVSSSECTWRCKTGFFQSGGACEACQTFDETVAFLGVSGARVANAFYRFEACSAIAQARAEVCGVGDFGVSLAGAYIADGRAFGKDCPLQCAENSNLHSVPVNLTRGGVSWTAQRCVECPVSNWPLFVNLTRLPRHAFQMSSTCVATCAQSMGFYAHTNHSRTCLFCPPGTCQAGFYFSSSNNCATCQPCSRSLVGGVFKASGTFDDARSCPESCPTGHFIDEQTCRQHSILTCRPGLQYAVAGTETEDARCDTCSDCSGAKEVAPCTLTSNRECASCGIIDTWSSTWSKTGCTLTCRTELGYTKLYTTDGEVCRKCRPCPVGQALPGRPANCTCQPCGSNIPAKAVYTKACEWACPLYHVARLDAAGALVCEYNIRPTSNVINRLRSISPVTCPHGQRLTNDPRPAAYAAFICENCSTPAGMRIENLNVTWIWDRDCTWQCVWGLEKQTVGGKFVCESLRYTHKVKNQTTTVKQELSGDLMLAHIVGIIVGAIIFVVFGMCFMCRMLPG